MHLFKNLHGLGQIVEGAAGGKANFDGVCIDLPHVLGLFDGKLEVN